MMESSLTEPRSVSFETFLRTLLREPSATRLLRTLDGDGSVQVDVSGLRGAAPAFLAGAVARTRPGPCLVVCAHNEAAEDFAEDLQVLCPDADPVVIPGPEVLPYDPTPPDIHLTGRRVRGLDRLRRREGRVFVTTVRALLEKVPPPESLEATVLDLRAGRALDLDDLERWLEETGYRRYPVVEERGHYSIRGGILDVFPPAEETPMRIELLEEEIESIRSFDLETQRSIAEVGLFRLLPARSVRVRLEPRNEVLERARRHGVDASALDAWLEGLEQGTEELGAETAYFEDLVPMTSYLGENPLVFWHRVESLEERFEVHFKEVERYHAEMLGTRPSTPPPGALYLGPEELHEMARLHTGVFFWELRAADSEPFAPPGTPPGGRTHLTFSTRSPESYRGRLRRLRSELEELVGQGTGVFLFCDNRGQAERLAEILEETADGLALPVGHLSGGFIWPSLRLAVLTDHEIFDRYRHRFRPRALRSRRERIDYAQLQPGDFVVHVNHGIGRYHGLRVLTVDARETECLVLRYEGGDTLFVPVDQLQMVEKYVAKEGAVPSLSRLGTSSWARTKERARKAAEDVAGELLEIYARREIRQGFRFSQDNNWQRELEASFIYEETPHQMRAVEEVKRDMTSERPMDRLVCGDVGYGKTEVAIRAAFKTVLDDKQTAVLVPTTILAQQHMNTFSDRLADFPVKVEMLSRFRSPRDQKRILEEVARGEVDVLIGTHRLLSRDVVFRDLGLLVIDEEHRFGVRQKEKLKALKAEVDVLTLTATPIPRTLNMALAGARDMSLITTPPKERLPIQTHILPFDEDLVRNAVLREADRGGQVFFVHNRVETIDAVAAQVSRLVPELRFGVGHGQMSEKALEEVMVRFLEREFDVLVATMIIESGLDFPNVNTIIVNRADRLGLAQLYQLRGRVGRSRHRAYAYLLIPRGAGLTSEARRRLQTLEEFDHLGAGYRIAMRDLELRGAGNILGSRQHGHIAAVGFDLYTRMLRETVARMRGEEVEEERPLVLEVPVRAYLPEDYVEDPDERMALYRRIAAAQGEDVLEELEEELRDRFGPPPEEAAELIRFARVRVLALAAGVARLSLRRGRLAVEFHPDRVPGRSVIGRLAGTFPDRLAFNSGGGFSVHLEMRDGRPLLDARELLLACINCD
jgi:transcription-repair coupling factor (superfamily II helicase)